PATPTELVQPRIIGDSAAAVPTAWKFERNGKEEVIPLQPHCSTNENEGAIAAAVAGFGITSTSGWACSRELEDGSLIRLFLDWKMVGIPVHAYFPMGSATRTVGRAAVDHTVAEFRRSADLLPS
ncbi:MAG TPA: LysR substrate-binding domain-containing protein, partial [Acetobacteraceae bacterium]|nr:LysR substrate-binding domain-containing protein [Acetobacteraceae bacterium]